MIETDSCPFCGYNKLIIVDSPDESYSYAVKCTMCFAYGPPANHNGPSKNEDILKGEAKVRWNKRSERK